MYFSSQSTLKKSKKSKESKKPAMKSSVMPIQSPSKAQESPRKSSCPRSWALLGLPAETRPRSRHDFVDFVDFLDFSQPPPAGGAISFAAAM